ncbi:hypothetical protein FB567DRAFT_471573, partial [Paraphoma chrysanthemicola]
MSIRRATSQLLPARSVHLRIVPRPADLSESREILRVLKRFGEIDVFKSLRYEYHNPADNIALAIFRDSTAAQKALDASPIRFALEKVDQHPSIHEPDSHNDLEDEDAEDAETLHSKKPPKHGIDEILRPSTLLTRTEDTSPTPPTTTTTPQPSMPYDPPTPSTPTHTRTKWFQVTVDRSRAVHQDFVERQPFWKQFHPQKSLAQEDLAKKVPHIGLSDVSKRPPNAHRTPNRVLKVMSEYVERGMPSLSGMVADSEGERGFRERRGRR